MQSIYCMQILEMISQGILLKYSNVLGNFKHSWLIAQRKYWYVKLNILSEFYDCWSIHNQIGPTESKVHVYKISSIHIKSLRELLSISQKNRS